MATCLKSAVAAVADGGIKHDKTAIADLLFNEFEALRFIKQDEVADLVESVFDAVQGGQRAVWIPIAAMFLPICGSVLTFLKMLVLTVMCASMVRKSLSMLLLVTPTRVVSGDDCEGNS